MTDNSVERRDGPWHSAKPRLLARTLKRAFDVAFATTLLLILAPLLLSIAGLVRVRLGSPILFQQERPGIDAKPFVLLKFRTMTLDLDTAGKLLPDEERMTGFGTRLRNLSLDELPELFNVLMGQMSVVGPRPLLMHYLPHYTPEQARRHAVKPGLTGPAVVNGRNLLTWEEKFQWDVWYVDHWSLLVDFTIIVKTISLIMSRKGITQPGRSTVDYFKVEE